MSNLAGTTWIFNENINLPSPSQNYKCSVSSGELFFDSVNEVSRTQIFAGYTQIVYGTTGYWVYTPQNAWRDDRLRTITFTSEPETFVPDESTFMAWLCENATRQPSQYYITNDAELGTLADAIRTKLGHDANILGKNLLDPTTNTAYVQSNTTYTLSVTITWDGEINSLGEITYYMINGVVGRRGFQATYPPPAAETKRETVNITIPNNCYKLAISIDEGLNPTNAQLELGSTATEYEPYTSTNLLSYPTDYIDKIINTPNLVHVDGAMSEYTYYPGTTNDTILTSGTYIEGDQIIAAVQQSNLTSANIKNGTTVIIYSQSSSNPIYSVTGTYQGSSPSPVSFSTYIDCNNSSGTCSTSRYFKLETFSNFYEQLASNIGCSSSSKIHINKMSTGDTSGIVVNRFYGESNITLYILNTNSKSISIPEAVRVQIEGYYTP